MKKVYEAPKMCVETVQVEEMMATTSVAINKEVEVTNLDEQLLTKDRNDNWGGLLW